MKNVTKFTESDILDDDIFGSMAILGKMPKVAGPVYPNKSPRHMLSFVLPQRGLLYTSAKPYAWKCIMELAPSEKILALTETE